MIKIKLRKKINESEENAILEANVNFLLNNSKAYAALEDLDLNEDDISELVPEITPLKSVRIVEFISGKSFGKIFRLENNKVLKLFSHSRNIEDDKKWYESSGWLHGEWGYVGRDPVYWVIMPYFIPYDQYLRKTNRDENKAGQEFNLLVKTFAEKKGMAAEIIRDLPKLSNIKKTEVLPILKAVREVYRFNPDLEDVNIRNIGLVVDKDGEIDEGKPVFVVFDR